jgi:hypothetical protein
MFFKTLIAYRTIKAVAKPSIAVWYWPTAAYQYCGFIRQTRLLPKINLRPTKAFHKMGELGQYLVN